MACARCAAAEKVLGGEAHLRIAVALFRRLAVPGRRIGQGPRHEFPALMQQPQGVLRTRKAANRFHAAKLNKYGQCGSSIPSHRACPSCGYYKGRQVLTIEAL